MSACIYYGGCSREAQGPGAEPFSDGSSAAEFCDQHSAAYMRCVQEAAEIVTRLVRAGMTHEEADEWFWGADSQEVQP